MKQISTRLILLLLLLLPLSVFSQTPSSNITYPSLNTTSYTINWTSGTGVGRIAVLRAASSGIALPVDNTVYTASTTFGSGSNLGNQNYVIYRGTGNSVTVFGLSPYTNYTLTIFEYSGSASVPNYGTLFYASSSRYTLATQPTVSPTSLTASNINVNTVSLNWTNGDGVYTLTTVRQSTSNSNSPTDGEVYSASAAFGGGDPIGSTTPYSYVVYNTTGSSLTVSGLSPATDYTAAAYAYNGLFGAQNYRTSAIPTDGFTTLASQPTANASLLNFRDIEDDAMTISWLNTATTAGGGTNHLVLMSTSPVADLPSDGVVYIGNNNYGTGSAIGQSFVVYNGTGNAFRVSNLSMETQYYIRVFEYNGGLGTYNPTTNYLTSTYLSGQQFSNTTHPGLAASNITFTGVTANTVTVNWTGGGGTNKIITARPGKRQTALAFDGVNDHVVVPFSSTLQPASEVTLECWVNRSNWATSTGIEYFAGNAEFGGYCLLQSGTTVYAYAYRNGNWGFAAYSVAHLSPGWHHFAVTYDGRYTRGYVDGAIYGQNDAGGNYGLDYTYSNAFIIGADVGTSSTTSGSFCTGQIDEVRVWNTEQSSSLLNSYMNTSLLGNEFGLIGYWRLDDGTTASNIAVNSDATGGTALNGTLNMSSAAATNTTATSGWIYSTSPVNAPVDFTGYNYNSNITTTPAAQVGLQTLSVLNAGGSSQSITVTGLTPGSWYNFNVFDYDSMFTYPNLFTNYVSTLVLSGEIQTQTATPTISSISPVSGPIGTVVTINGTNFSPTTTSNTVYFGAVRATVITATTTQLTVSVPFGAQFVPVTVAVNGLTAASPREFNVTSVCAATINTSSFSNSAISTASGAYEHRQLDVNADGRPDLICNLFGSDIVNVFRGSSINGVTPPQFNSVLNYNTPENPYSTEIADVDMDGRPDLIVGNTTGGIISVHRIASNGSLFIPALQYPVLSSVSPSIIKAGDFDGDGKTDIAVGYFSGSFITVLRNSGTYGAPEFDAPIHINVGNISPSSMYVRDLDGDGKADIAFGSLTGANFYTLRSTSTTGTISFATQQTFSITSGTVKNIASGDFNLDGKPDLVVATSTNNLRLYSNGSTSGNISFTQSVTLATLSSGAYAPICNDLDGDGRQDIVLGYESANSISIWEATGSFGFATRVDFTPSGGTASINVSVGDFNADGRPDIASSSVSSGINILANTMNTLDSEPSTAASGVTISGITQTSMTLNFTAGSGANRIVLARQGSSVTTLPADGTGYTANSTFGAGSNLGGGTYVVYSGNSNSVNITGLQSNSFYFFAVIEYNGSSCTSNYLISSFGTANNQTLNTPPTLNAISNPAALCRNSGIQSVSLSGIGTGAVNETQTLTITATSNNTSLIPNPTVSYTSPNASGSLSYTPVTNATGTATITVTVNDGASNNNTLQRTFVVTVNAPPTTSAAGANQTVCTGTATLAANAPAVGTGTWSIASTNNPSITTANLGNVNTPNTTLSGLLAGNVVTLTWTITNPPCTPSTSNVTITRGTCPLTANFTWSPTSLCATASTTNPISFTDASFAPSSSIQSWTWTFAGPVTPSPASSTAQNPSNIQFTGPGTFTVTLTVNDGNTNSQSTQFITINPFPAAPGSITGPSTVCQGQTNVPFSVAPVANATSYNWSLPAGATIVSGTGTNSILVNFSNTATSNFVTVLGVNACGNGLSSPPLSVTVFPLPAATTVISGPSSVCQGQNNVVFATSSVANATGYSWTLPVGATIISGNNTNSITVNFSSAAQSGPVEVVATNSCGNGATSTSLNLTVNPLPDAAGVITSNTASSVCQGASGVTYTIPPVANATSYNWTLPSGATIVSGNGTNSITVDYNNLSASGTVSVAGVNSCGSGNTSSFAVTINPLPSAAGAILGTDTVCQGDFSVSYFVSTIANASTYVWTLPAGASIASGSGTESITVDFGVSAVSGPVTVYAQNGCGSGTVSAPINVTVNPLPATPGTIAGSAVVCQAQTGVTYSIPALANATGYNWILPPGATIISGNNTNSITVDFSASAVSGIVLVNGTNACGDGMYSDTLTLTVNPLPDAAGAITGTALVNICPTATGIIYSVPAITNATTYVWDVPSGATITSGAGTNTITVDYAANAQAGAVSVFGQNACGNGDTTFLSISYSQVTPSDICLVTVDSVSQYNRVVWEKPVATDIDSFRIYREVTTNVYVPVGAVSYDSLSLFIDSAYTPLANPNTTYYRYKITSVDSCGNESGMGPHHRTLFLQTNVGVGGVVNLSWSLYEGATVSFYRIMRDSTNLGQWEVIDSVPGNNTLYTDINPPTSIAVNNIRYKLQTIWLVSCNPTRNIVTSESNLGDVPRILFSVAETGFGGQVYVYPNPSEGNFSVMCPYSETGYNIAVFDAPGRLVYKQDVESRNLSRGENRIDLPLAGLASGTYFLVMQDAEGRTARLKLVIQN
jgi:PKD-like domain/Concanavalin A-like lectin/glucanases superfamily/FG-GAP-like repeat/IPT/TIG domain/Secretion system C-terminal sorting domain